MSEKECQGEGAPVACGEAGTPGRVAFPYAAAGAAFTAWFNDHVRRLNSPTVWVGTTLARVIELHRDGRLEVEVETEALEPERVFVPFEAAYLDQLVRKVAALGP
jgi:hypothetical protein